MNSHVVASVVSLHRPPLVWAALAAAALTVWTPSASAGDGKFIINVMDYGATGDGSTDDRAAIQAALDAAKSDTVRADGTSSPRGVVVYFPEGVYTVEGTLFLCRSSGIEIVGAGTPAADLRDNSLFTQTYHYASNPANPLVYVNGPSTAIIARFKAPMPLFNFGDGPTGADIGQVGNSMRDMILYGCPLGDETARANCTSLIHTGSRGFGNSFNKYEGLVLRDALKGFTLGASSSDGNNDTLVFERINAFDVDTVFQPQTTQALNHVYRQIGATNCITVFDYDNGATAGGAVSVDTVSLTGCGGSGTEDWVIKVHGHVNTGAFRFVNVRPETTTEQLLRSRGVGVTEIANLQDARLYSANHPALIRIEGGSVLLSASEVVPNTNGTTIGFAPVVEFVASSGYKRTFRVRDSILPTTRPALGGTGYLSDIIKNFSTIPGNSFYRVHTCDDQTVEPLSDATIAGSW